MAVYKIFPNKDASIYSRYSTLNAGRDEILEVSVKNLTSIAGVSENIAATGIDDIRRTLLSFSNSDINLLKSFESQSFSANLRLFLASAENLSQNYTIQCLPLAQNWDMGTGKFNDNPPTEDGVSWQKTGPATGSISWDPAYGTETYLFTTGGGTWNGSYLTTQSFDYISNKDLNLNITSTVNGWFTGSINNYGIILKHSSSVELNTGSYIDLKFFSIDTHTIYPPCIDFKWDDSSYNTGSNTNGIITSDNFVLNVGNNLGEYKKDTIYNFNLKARDKFPTRQFTTSSVYLNWKYLPTTSYWAIQDYKTTETIIDFDTNYTKISANTNGNYFTVYMKGLQPERTYKLLVKTILSDSEEIVVDNDILFKIVR
jgi:hypothetical protein